MYIAGSTEEVAWLPVFNMYCRLYWRGCVIIQYVLQALLTKLRNYSICIAGSTDEIAWLFNMYCRLYWRGCVIIQFVLHALLTRLRDYSICIAGSTDEVVWLFNMYCRLYWRVLCGTVVASVLWTECRGPDQAGTNSSQLHTSALPGQ